MKELDRHIATGDRVGAARAVVASGVDALMAIDLAELRAFMARLGDATAEAPESLLLYAQVIEQSLYRDERTDLLDRLVAIATERGDDRLLRATRAEQGRDLVREWRPDEAIRSVTSVLDDLGASETSVRARALGTLGGAHLIRRGPGDVAHAEECLRESAALARQLGLRTWEAQALSWLGYNILYPEGDDSEAITVLDRALSVAIPGSRVASVVRVVHAAVLLGAGHPDEAVVHLRAMEDDAKAQADSRGLAWAAWTWARHAAYRNDLVGLLTRLDTVERHRTDWFDAPEGVEFLAEASELAQALGDEHTAHRYLDRAEERARAEGLEHMVMIARAGFEARFGDPHLGAKLLADDPGYPALLRRNRWLIEVLRAVAADRRGESVEARRLAAHAIGQADAMGHAHLLLHREPVLAPRVIALAVEGGSSAARQLASLRPPEVRVAVFGRFRVQVRGVDCTPTGQAGILVKRVALEGGTAPIDRVIEWFWPDDAPSVGRRRVRNLLNRLRSMSGDVVVRDHDHLRIPDASIDLVTVESAIDRLDAWAPDAPDSVRDSWQLVSGQLLADDPYEEWAVEARDRVSLRLVGAADRMAADAELRGDRAGAAVWLERAIQLEPYDLDRHTKLIDVLTGLGDRSRLQLAARRAVDAYRELRIDPPAAISVHLPSGSA
ncbi:MAG: hypothetical protein ACXIVQ_09330 [Acidimicrobiales bacterium]